MTIALNNTTYVGMSNLTIQRLSDNVVYSFPSPADFVLSTGVAERPQMAKNDLGQTVRARSFAISQMPVLQVRYTHIRPEMIGFRVGRQMTEEPVPITTHLPKLIQVTKNTYSAAEANLPATGVNPATSYGSKLDPSTANTVELPRDADFATFDHTETNSFAVSPTGGLKFSNNLIGQVVTLAIGYVSEAIKLSEQLIGDVKITAALVNTNNQVDIFEAGAATPALDNAQIQFGGEGMDMAFNLNNIPGRCAPWDLYQTGIIVSC